MKQKLVIREAAESDLGDLAEISRTTWDGDDYLESVSKRWLELRHFYVGELSGKVIACGKITSLPGRVAWLEGLRVHRDFKGRGFGRSLSDSILQIACEKQKSGEFGSIEFSTYINNVESISMAVKQGFKVSEFFHVISIDNPPMADNSVKLLKTSPVKQDFSVYPDHAPCGWKYINHKSTGSVEWMKENAMFWKVDTGARFLTAKRGLEVSPLAAAFDDPEGFVKGVFAMAERKRLDYLEVMVHDSHRNMLAQLLESGFSYWDDQGRANLPIYRFSGKK